MEVIPYELLYPLLLTLPYEDIINFCSTNITNKSICNDKYFW